MRIVSTIPGQSVMAEGAKDFNYMILAILLVVGFIVFLLASILVGLIIFGVALVYFFMAPKNVFSLGLTPTERGSRVSITSTGSKAESAQNQLIGVLQLGAMGVATTRQCRSCGASIPATSLFCPACGTRQ